MKLERYFSKGSNSPWRSIHIFRYLQFDKIISKLSPNQNWIKINLVKKCKLKTCECYFDVNVNPFFKLWNHPYITSAYGLGRWAQKIAIFANVQCYRWIFFIKCDSFFKSPDLKKKIIPKNYPELEI